MQFCQYELKTEEIEYKNKLVSIVKLTSDNVARVEAMIATDSDYNFSLSFFGVWIIFINSYLLFEFFKYSFSSFLSIPNILS